MTYGLSTPNNRRIVRAAIPRGTSGLRTYSTDFLTVENPLSEAGNFINGGTVGLDWNNMRVATPGQCYGLQGNGSFKDGTAILTGAWAANQRAQGTIYTNSPPDASFPECELRLRSAISPHVNTGYEITWSCGSGGSIAPYLIIVRWNGPVGSFDYLLHLQDGGAYNVTTGDVIAATINGNTINAFKNGVLQGSVDITSMGGTVFSSGAPGIGHNSESDGSNNDKYGFSHFDATEL